MPVGRYDGRVAVVTGGANGLGRAIVTGLLAEGAKVAICDLAEATAFAGNDDVRSHVVDIADPDQVPQVIADTAAHWGQVDLLVNDAAAYPNGGLFEMSLEEWHHVFDVNVFSTVASIRAFAQHCIDRGADDASIVNISTGSVASPRPAGGAYASSKAAVEVMSKTYAMELAPHGIRVNVVAPATSTSGSGARPTRIARPRSCGRHSSTRSRSALPVTRPTSRTQCCSSDLRPPATSPGSSCRLTAAHWPAATPWVRAQWARIGERHS